MRYPDRKMLVVDSGLFVEFAVRMARDFGEVYFGSTPDDAFPTSAPAAIGENLDGVIRIGAKDPLESVFDYIDQVDIIAFPDVYRRGLQEQLRREGKRVWGCGAAARWELDRWWAKKQLAKLKLDVPETERIKGMSKLREKLKPVKDRYVKISFWRGDFETFHYTDYEMFDEILDEIESRLGAKKDLMEFLVEMPTDPESIEIGYDGYTIDGQFPTTAMYGYEVKDKAYIGYIRPYKEFPKFMQTLNEKLGPSFAEMKFRGNYSNEIRVQKDKTYFLTDPTCRMPSPPGEIMLEAFENLPEFVFEGAGGKMVELKPLAKYTALAEIHSDYARKNWMPVRIPEKNRQWVKFKNITKAKGKYELVPSFGDLKELGAVIGMGKTIDEAIAQVNAHAEGLDGYDLSIKVESLNDAQEVIATGKKFGIQF